MINLENENIIEDINQTSLNKVTNEELNDLPLKENSEEKIVNKFIKNSSYKSSLKSKNMNNLRKIISKGQKRLTPKKKVKKRQIVEKKEMNEQDEQEYQVKEIIGKTFINGKEHYLVYWEGYSLEESTWEPMGNLINCISLVEEFEKKEQLKSKMHGTPKKKFESKLEYKSNSPINMEFNKEISSNNIIQLSNPHYKEINSNQNINDNLENFKKNTNLKQNCNNNPLDLKKQTNNFRNNIVNLNINNNNNVNIPSLKIGIPIQILSIKSGAFIKRTLSKNKISKTIFPTVVNFKGDELTILNNGSEYETINQNISGNKAQELFILVECNKQGKNEQIYCSTDYFKLYHPAMLVDFYEKSVKLKEDK